MITRTIELNDATLFCNREEDHFFDKKAKDVAPGKILHHIAAFANADGGELIIGIDD